MGFIKTSAIRDQVAMQDAYIKAYMDKTSAAPFPAMTTVAEKGNGFMNILGAGMYDLKDKATATAKDFGKWVHENPNQALAGLATAIAAHRILK